MGLSGRKVKQRIGADPRNLSWADDAARFGQNYLSKFGWDASKGLGAGGDGMKSHIKVSHKLDMLGIGAAQQKDPNGLAWKQNRDFENLLERLNKNLAEEAAASPAPEVEGEGDAGSDKEDEVEGDKKKKKRKHKETDVDEDGEERKEKKKSKKSKKAEKDGEDMEKIISVVSESVQFETVVEVKKTVVVPRHRAHRARAIAAKNISSKSAAHVSEILGIAPDATPAPPVEAEPPTTKGKLTSVTDTDALGMDKITTSTKSLADYFKDKLNARLGGDSGSSTPSSSRLDEEDDRPRGGIGASRMLFEIKATETTRVEEETQRVGLSKFSSLMSSQFLAAASTMSAYVPALQQEQEPESSARISEVEEDEEGDEDCVKRKGKKEKKDKAHKHGKHRKADSVVEEEAAEEESKKEKKKRKRDEKGKRKAEEEDVDVDEDAAEETAEVDEKARRKLEKKAKKAKKAEVEAAASVEEEKAASEDEEDKAARKKQKKKDKSSKERRKSSSGDS